VSLQSSDLARDYRVLREEVGAVWVPRDFVRISGPDAVTFLQGQLSQDVAGLDVGASALSLILQPQGKVDALVRVTRTGEDEVVLDVQGGWGEAVTTRLQRFKLRVKATLEPLAWRCLSLRGPAVTGLGQEPGPGPALAIPAYWPGLPGVDLIGADVEAPAGVPLCGLEALETVRVEAGVPAMGSELDERTIPAEAGILDETVSFTKGCYTGQELVARIDSRGGNVARRLRGVVIGDEARPAPGALLKAQTKEVGRLTSVVWSPARRAPVALAYVRRDVVPPADVTVSGTSGEVPARVEELPLVGGPGPAPGGEQA
jgi:folate-binding protein YgfZ